MVFATFTSVSCSPSTQCTTIYLHSASHHSDSMPFYQYQPADTLIAIEKQKWKAVFVYTHIAHHYRPYLYQFFFILYAHATHNKSHNGEYAYILSSDYRLQTYKYCADGITFLFYSNGLLNCYLIDLLMDPTE